MLETWYTACPSLLKVQLSLATMLCYDYCPWVLCVQVHDLLAIEVNDPADFPRHLGAAEKAALLPIQPIPFHPHPKRESLPDSALFLTIVHFPRKDIKRAECLQFAMGPRLIQGVCQGMLVL